ncbi:YbcC family protein [Marinobacter sp.]|uniref:YbcC family protein n=1 Tax=Marinobacter sp. TaxID=50741 RepID=UPI003561921E
MSDPNPALKSSLAQQDRLQEVVARACELVAPVWPLDQWIAVNPFWGMRHLLASSADRLLAARGGFSILMPAAFYREARAGGRISDGDLRASMDELGVAGDVRFHEEWLSRQHAAATSDRLLILNTFDSPEEAGAAVVDAVQRQIASVCAGFFDSRQSQWTSPEGNPDLYRYWLMVSRKDWSLDSRTGLRGAREYLTELPGDRTEALWVIVDALGVTEQELMAIAHSLLLHLNGWASWCRGEDWRAALEGSTSDRCGELLTVLLAWEWLALQCSTPAHREQWFRARSRARLTPASTEPGLLWVWQRAYESGYQRRLWQTLKSTSGQGEADEETEVQAVFCIDVRSEVLRRHLERACPAVQTLGFAGFFGLSVSHQALGPSRPQRHLPGLLPASYELIETLGNGDDDTAESRRLDERELVRSSVRKAKYGSLSTFSLVETTGLAWAWKLVRDSLKQGHDSGERSVAGRRSAGRLVHRHTHAPLSDREKAGLVAGMLRGMSLTRGFAPLVAFVGHGSHTDNNPNEAGLNCGACGGQSGAVSARLAAELFNDPAVRQALQDEQIFIPDQTRAVAAEHCTVTDEVTLLDAEKLSETHVRQLQQLVSGLERAARAARAERATPLKLNGTADEALKAAMETRTRDWSEVRPEWGLANNAAIIFAPRCRTRGTDLGGRVFLHEYEPQQDQDGTILKSLLAAPMVVANWINQQYFASVTEPEVYGSGNKLLHSVVGGNLGVVEGAGADLRIGLPLQSVHDGTYWRHEPLRLTVVVDAPGDRLEAAVRSQPDVMALVDNQWVLLHRFAGDGIERYSSGRWVSVDTP